MVAADARVVVAADARAATIANLAPAAVSCLIFMPNLVPHRIASFASCCADQNQRRISRAVWLCLVISTVLFMGCRESLPGQVVGTVRLNGERVVTGVVTFHPVDGGETATGKIASFGMYEVMTGRQIGLMPGKYHVTVTGRTVLEDHSGDKIPPQLMVPKKYGDSSLSGIEVTVSKGENRFPLELIRIAEQEPEDDKAGTEGESNSKPKPEDPTKTVDELLKKFDTQFPER